MVVILILENKVKCPSLYWHKRTVNSASLFLTRVKLRGRFLKGKQLRVFSCTSCSLLSLCCCAIVQFHPHLPSNSSRCSLTGLGAWGEKAKRCPHWQIKMIVAALHRPLSLQWSPSWRPSCWCGWDSCCCRRLALGSRSCSRQSERDSPEVRCAVRDYS